MTQQSFNTAVLRKIRDRIISALRAAGIELQRHYQLSAVNGYAANFNLKMAIKSATNQATVKRSSEVKTAISAELPDVTFTSFGNTGLDIHIDVTALYDILIDEAASPIDKKPLPVKVEAATDEDEPLKSSSKKKTYFQLLYNLISEKFFFGGEFDCKIIKHGGNKNIAELTVPDTIVYEVLEYFMSKKMRVIPTFDKKLIVYKDEIVDKKELQQEVVFLTDYNEASKILSELDVIVRYAITYISSGGGGEPIFSCLHSASELAANQLTLQVKFDIHDGLLANGVAELFTEMSVPASKIGNIVYLDITAKIDSVLLKKRFKELLGRDKKIKKGFVVKAGANGGQMVTHISHDYKQFHFLPFNRPRNPAHVKELQGYIQEFGFLDFVIVARTDVVDGEVKDWIVDRQHRFDALVLDSRPIPYAIIHVHSKRELIRLVAVLNSTSKAWQVKDYLRAWSTLQMEEYDVINKWKELLPPMVIIQSMTGLDRRSLGEKFRKGLLQFNNVDRGIKVMNDLLLLKPYLPKGYRYASAAIKFLYKVGSVEDNVFSMEKFVEGLEVKGLEFKPNDRDAQIVAKLEERLVA